jgi:hypothetical protein
MSSAPGAECPASCESYSVPYNASGTTITVAKKFDWSSCMDYASLTPVTTRPQLLASAGNSFFVDSNTCLHLKLTDPGHPWQPYYKSFERDGMYIEEEV